MKSWLLQLRKEVKSGKKWGKVRKSGEGGEKWGKVGISGERWGKVGLFWMTENHFRSQYATFFFEFFFQNGRPIFSRSIVGQ